MEVALAVTLISTLIAILAAVYARSQAASASAQLREARRANAIAAQQLDILKAERQAAEEVSFHFRPRQMGNHYSLGLFNNSPHDTYLLWLQLAGPSVDPAFNGIMLRDISLLGGKTFIEARQTEQIIGPTPYSTTEDLDQQRPRNMEPLSLNSSCQMILCLKTNGEIFLVTTELTLWGERGFETHGTKINKE